jgi:hypothetical protein
MLDVRFLATLLMIFPLSLAREMALACGINSLFQRAAYFTGQLSLAREVPWPVKFWRRTSPGFPLLHWAAFHISALNMASKAIVEC